MLVISLPSREIEVEVTAYTPWDEGCTGVTSTGKDVIKKRHCGVAVDPKTFPYGTKFYINGYGCATADDTGSAMRERTKETGKLPLIDIRMYSTKKALKWGRQTIKVWIYEEEK